jgi:hypothetical protein
VKLYTHVYWRRMGTHTSPLLSTESWIVRTPNDEKRAEEARKHTDTVAFFEHVMPDVRS